MRKYTVVLLCLFVCTFALTISLLKAEDQNFEVPPPKVEKYIKADKYYKINSFNHETKAFDKQAMEKFIASIDSKYDAGDIISIDGLKWMKVSTRGKGHVEAMFTPYPNPPIPVYEEGKENKLDHIQEYKEWIINHPHFGYPPLP